MKTLVSIINWNNSAATNACLESIARISKTNQPDIYLIDNNSQQEKLQLDTALPSKIRSLRTVHNNKNVGFAGGHNQAITYAAENAYDYVCLLNNDTQIIDTNLFAALQQELQNNPVAAAAAPTIVEGSDHKTVWFAGGELDIKNAVTNHFYAGKDVSQLPENTASSEVSFLTGCCLMIRLQKQKSKDMLLDDSYFLYWEDADWCAKMTKKNQKLLYVPFTKILHNTSSSLGAHSPRYTYYNVRNKLLFAAAWSSKYQVLPRTLWLICKIWILSLKKPYATPKVFWYSLRAVFDGMTNKRGPIA